MNHNNLLRLFLVRKTVNQQTLFEIEQDQFVDLKRASTWASQYLNKNITVSNISYLVQYGRINKYGETGTTINKYR